MEDQGQKKKNDEALGAYAGYLKAENDPYLSKDFDCNEYDTSAVDLKIKKLIIKSGKRRYSARKVAVIAIAILVSITLVGFGVILPFMDYFPWNRETHIVYMPDYDETQLKEAGFLYAPTKLPEGYYLANDPENGSGTLLYSNEAGESIQYHQLKGTLGIDNETDKKEVEKINGFSIDVIAKGEYIT